MVLISKLLAHDIKTLRIIGSDQTALLTQKANLNSPKIEIFCLSEGRQSDFISSLAGINIAFYFPPKRHLSQCEEQPKSTVIDMVQGAQKLIVASKESKIEKLIYISSDKAVNPSSVLGASYLMVEKFITHDQNSSKKFHS